MKNSVRSSGTHNRIRWLYPTAVLFLMVSAVCGIVLGSTGMPLGELFSALKEGMSSPAARILVYIRLPRTAAAILCGGALSVAGGVIQGVLANRLASPSVIGVNAGAGLGVTVCAALGIYGGWQLPFFAFIGAFTAVMAVSLGAKHWGGSRGTVILLGVAMSSLLGAVSDTVVTFRPEVSILRTDFRIGDFSAVTWEVLLPAAVLILMTLTVLLTLGSRLDVLSLGEDTARSLGMNTTLLRTLLLLLAAVLAGCAVSLAGLLSFVGLMVPHGVRRMAGSAGGHLMGLSALLGGGFVCLCDTVARTAFAPYEIPVGIIMAFLGVPFFLFVLIRGKGENRP